MTTLLSQLIDLLTRSTRVARLRSQLTHHADLVAKLPEGTARDRLLDHIDQLAERLVAVEGVRLARRRDFAKIATGAVIAVLLGWGSWEAIVAGGWWRLTLLLSVPFIMGSISYLVDEFRGRAPGDERQHRPT